MNEQSIKNKNAWEYRAYEFWTRRNGTPQDFAKRLIEDPLTQLKKHKQYFEHIKGKKIANLCGSNGRKAVPLALLGAEVTVFDISEENKAYAMELAKYANTSIHYDVIDLYDIDLNKYRDNFDMLYLEGGILHYFHDINQLMTILHTILKPEGQMILSDFHPLRKCLIKDDIEVNYFNKELQSGDVAYKTFFDEDEQQQFPNVSLRQYTLSEIINSIIQSGFHLKKFDEHPGWNNENIPWEFTILASKIDVR